MSEPRWLLDSAVLLAHEICLANFGGAEGIRDSGLLESAMSRPRNLYAYREYDLHVLASAYTTAIVMNRPFVDGNRRTGFLAGAAFLELNGRRLTATEPDATRIMFGLAAGEVTDSQFAEWLRANSEKA